MEEDSLDKYGHGPEVTNDHNDDIVTKAKAGDGAVCGKDGVVYSNQCLARCKGVAVECLGECPCPYSVTTPSSYPDLGFHKTADIFSYFEFASDGKFWPELVHHL